MAFQQVVADVRAFFLARGITAEVDVGWKARAKTTNQGPGSANRVVFTPVSSLTPIAPTHIGNDFERPARQLLNVLFQYEVSFWGFDAADDGENDLLHIAKCVELFEATEQAIHRSHYGTYEWGAMRWTDTVKHVVHGAELIAPITINLPIFDVADTFHKPVSPEPTKIPDLGIPPEETP